jgi:hypothetical protein
MPAASPCGRARRSAPMTNPDAPTVGRVISAASQVPVEISSTRHPGATSAAVITIGTKRRDQRPTQPSWAKAFAAWPGATCRPGAKLAFMAASRRVSSRGQIGTRLSLMQVDVTITERPLANGSSPPISAVAAGRPPNSNLHDALAGDAAADSVEALAADYFGKSPDRGRGGRKSG